MTRIDFYVLASNKPEDSDLFACRLAEKATRAGLRVLLAVDSEDHATRLDELLWTFREDSYVPHNRQSEEKNALVEVNCGEDPADHHGLLINLCSDLPAWFSRFERLAEIVIQEPGSLERSRTRFSHFRDRGYPLQTHKIGG